MLAEPSCHPRLLVTSVLQRAGVSVVHIRGDGSVEPDDGPHAASPQPCLFR
jgi:hypothetical protein